MRFASGCCKPWSLKLPPPTLMTRLPGICTESLPAHSVNPRGQVALIMTTPLLDARADFETFSFGPPGRWMTRTPPLVAVAAPAGFTPVTRQLKR